jgi:hypothetical protein
VTCPAAGPEIAGPAGWRWLGGAAVLVLLLAGYLRVSSVVAGFGMPTDVYRFDGFTVYTWNVNLLTKLHK